MSDQTCMPIKNFTSVKRTPKVSELIVQQMKDCILDGGLKPGERIPPERQLVEDFGASRVSVREALKKLEVSGLVTIKPGLGAFVSEMNSKPLTESFSSILRIHKARISYLAEARVMLEPHVAALACDRVTPEDLAKLEENIQDTLGNLQSDPDAASYQNLRFHCLLAEITHNPVLELITKTVIDVLKTWMEESDPDLQDRIKVDSLSITNHKNIVKALSKKNRKQVHKLVLKDVLEVYRYWDGIQFEGKAPGARSNKRKPRNR